MAPPRPGRAAPAASAAAGRVVSPPGSSLPGRLNLRADAALVAGIGLAALAVVAYFDVASNLALGDEFTFRWSVERLAQGQGLQLWPGVVPTSLVQAVATMPLALFHPEPRFLRLAVLPFSVLSFAMSTAIARRFGADSFWALIAGVAVAAAPLTLSVSAAFTSDIAYLGLLMTSAYLGLRWIQEGRGAWWFVVAATLATTQRQQGVALAFAVTVLVLLRRRPLAARDQWCLAATWVGTVTALAFPFATGIASHQMTTILHNEGTQHLTLGAAAGSLLELGPMVGLLLLPLAAAMLRRGDSQDPGPARWQLVPFSVAVATLASASMFALFFGTSIWPGNVWGIWGLGPLYIGGSKPPLYPQWAFVLLEALVVVHVLVLFGWRRRLWTPNLLGSGGIFLVLLAVGHLPPMALASPLDRYYIPLAAVVTPMLAAEASRRSGVGGLSVAARAWAIVVLLGGVIVFVVGQQDYLAWQGARAEAQAKAYARFGPRRVDAGYEANASGLSIPEFDRTGTLIDPVHLAGLNPPVALRFAGPADTRPGVAYSSTAPGKIVYVLNASGGGGVGR